MTTIQAGQYQRATEVLALDEPFSDDDVNKGADAYESAHGIPLVRPHEEDEYGRPTAKFEERMKTFQFRATAEGVSGDPAVHRRELDKLMAIAKRKGFRDLSPREKAGIEENRKALGMEPMDWSDEHRSAKDIAGSAQKKYAYIQKNSLSYNDRLAAVRALTDIQTLELFAEADKSEQVREAAIDRIQAVRLMEIPGQ